MGQKLSEYHTGYRAYHRAVLQSIPFQQNSDDFVFDNELLAQIFYRGYEVAEVTCPTKYFAEASSINFSRSAIYGLGVLRVSLQYFLQKMNAGRFNIFNGVVPGSGSFRMQTPAAETAATLPGSEQRTLNEVKP